MNFGMSSLSAEDVVEEVQMISQSCDFDEFLESVRDRDYLEVIYLADREATEAERLKYRSRTRRLDPPEACAGYADVPERVHPFHALRRQEPFDGRHPARGATSVPQGGA